MSISKSVYPVCDECGYCEPLAYSASESKAARKTAREDGWHRKKGNDICSECWEKQQMIIARGKLRIHLSRA